MSKQRRTRRRPKKQPRTSSQQQRADPRPIIVWPAPAEHGCDLAKWEVTPAHLARQVEIWNTRRQIDSYPTVPSALAAAGDQGCGEVWLWCLHCHRFFQAKHLELDFLGNWQRCPYDDCQAAGFDVDILHWTHGKTEPDWPSDQAELQVGMQYPPCHCPRCTAVREGRSPMPETAEEVGRAQ